MTVARAAAAHISYKQLYLISFIEGGVVMVTEIAGARILTPFFGASLYSWAATLSITLFALMAGYYTGGYATTKPQFHSREKIYWVFLASGLSVLLMPATGQFIMQRTISFSYFTALIISELIFLFPPIFLMGMISPMIIYQITKKAEESGRSAGNIYAISTCGGIVFTLAFGFIVIPYYGITLPVRILGICVTIIGILMLRKDRGVAAKAPLALLLGILLVATALSQRKDHRFSSRVNKKLLEYSEGLLGELKVIDELVYSPGGTPTTIRKLKTNNIQQNYVFAQLPTQSLLHYVNFTRQLLNFLPKKKSALLIGLGAGSLYSILSKAHMDVETVEIDQRIYDIGIKYFGMPAHEKHFITDGRYYINVTDKKYDVILLDVIIGESIPGQLLTLESFRRIYQLLDEDGTFIIEHGGLNDIRENTLVPPLIKTLRDAGFEVLPFNPVLGQTFGDVLFVARKKAFDISHIKFSDDVLVKGAPLKDYMLKVSDAEIGAAEVLTDDRNNIDLLLKTHYLEVRKGIRKELGKLQALME
jgi:predicted membrane-bound spermidine synthase